MLLGTGSVRKRSSLVDEHWYKNPVTKREGYVVGSFTIYSMIGMDNQTLHRLTRDGYVKRAKESIGTGNPSWYWKDDIPLMLAMLDLKHLHYPKTYQQTMRLISEHHQDGDGLLSIDCGRVTLIVDLEQDAKT